MYVILVYDAKPKRGAKLLKFLRQHLQWVQNSVFEGEITGSQFEQIISGVKNIVNKEKDSVIYYAFDSQNYTERNVIGVERNEIDSFI